MSPEQPLEQPNVHRRSRWQFGLGQLMIFVVVIAVGMAFTRWWGIAGLIGFALFAVPLVLRRPGAPADLLLLKCLSGYCVASSLTLPFLDHLWLGEIPLLVLFQFPKIPSASWLRQDVVMVLIRRFGLSRGSFSPDYIMASPYALAITYLLPLLILLTTIWVRRRMVGPNRRWAIILVVVAAVDYALTLHFACGPGLSIY